MMTAVIDILAIVAHPDDAELLCGGTLLVAADLGQRTGVLDLSAGEAGSAGTREGRASERDRASEILRLSARRTAELPDGALENTPAARLRVAAILRELRPQVVILHWPEARHPDHRAAAELGRDACFVAGMHRAGAPGSRHRPHKILHALTYQEHAPKPTFVVDISAQMERKLESIFAYGSQFSGKTRMGDVMGGERPLPEQILAHHAHYGALIRRPYGEPFFTRETMHVDDLLTLGVASM
jgi:bacillithiol biosynthesis deacetylase BshB1